MIQQATAPGTTYSSDVVRGMIFGRDPLARIVVRASRGGKPSRVLFATFLYQLATKITPAFFFAIHSRASLNFRNIFQVREAIGVSLFEMVFPLTCMFFWALQPIRAERLFGSLHSLVATRPSEKTLMAFLDTHVRQPLSSRWTVVASAAYAAGVVSAGVIPAWRGSPASPVWWGLNPYYFWGVFAVGFVLAGHIVCWGAIRQVVVIRALYAFFSQYDVRPRIMDADGCMGLSAVGDYAFFFCLPIVIAAVALLGALLLPPPDA